MFIYALTDPRDGKIKYVGKTVCALGKRLREHVSRSPKVSYRAGRWIQSLVKQGLTPRIELLMETSSLAELNRLEVEYIAFGRALGLDLTNATDGGEGCHGYRHDADARARISEAKRGKLSPRLGTKHSDETKAKIAAAKLGKPSGTRGQKRSRIAVLRNSIAQGGKPFSDQFGRVYQTQNDAARAIGAPQANVRLVLLGKRLQVKGYRFKYLDGSTPEWVSKKVTK